MVEVVQSISDITGEIRSLASDIAVTVEQQGKATAEISINANYAATATESVAHSVAGAAKSVNATSRSASDVLMASGRLAGQEKVLRASVEEFLAKVAA